MSLYIGATGLMWENAPAFKALLVFAEHRFYGESLPFGAFDKGRELLRWARVERVGERGESPPPTRLPISGACVVSLDPLASSPALERDWIALREHGVG